MHTLNKKRRLNSHKNNDDDWGDDITAEEFDFLQSQVVAPKQSEVEPIPAAGPAPISIIPNIQQQLEEQEAQEGQIRILRESLEKKSRELAVERLEREQQINQRLKEQNKKECELKLNIDRLESALKFKQHELSSAYDKIKLFEQKSKFISNSKVQSGTPVKKQSPVKTPLIVTSNNFVNIPILKEISVQTETMNVISVSHRKCILRSNILYNSVSNKTVCKEDNKLIPQCKIEPELEQDFKIESVSSRHCTINASSFSVNQQLSDNPLPIPCCCQTRLVECFPNKESEFLKIAFDQLKLYVRNLTDHKHQEPYCQSESERSNSELSCGDSEILIPISTSTRIKRVEWNRLAKWTAMYLSNLCNLLTSSNTACVLLVKPHQSNCNDRTLDALSKEMIPLIWSCTKPVFFGPEIVNHSVVNSALTVLNILFNNCGQCCINDFSTTLPAVKLSKLLNGSCGLETAHLTIEVLTACVGIKNIEIHCDNLCLFRNLEKLLCGFSRNRDVKLDTFLVSLINWLTVLIVNRGVFSVFNERCVCLATVLKLVCMCLLDSAHLDCKLVLKMLQLLQILVKLLGSLKWADLQMRMENCFLLMLNKLHHSELFPNPTHRGIIVELCEYAKIPVIADKCVPMEC